MLEKVIETHLMKEVKKRGGICWKLPAMWYKNIPDRMVLLPHGIVAFVELKRPGEKAREGQNRMGALLLALGFKWTVLDTKEGVDAFLEELKK